MTVVLFRGGGGGNLVLELYFLYICIIISHLNFVFAMKSVRIEKIFHHGAYRIGVFLIRILKLLPF